MNEQKTQEWHDERCGDITASRFSDCLAVTPEKYKVLRATGTTLKVFNEKHAAAKFTDEANEKKPGHMLKICPSEPLKTFSNYVEELVCERLTGEVRMIGEPPAIRWGNDFESFALRAYEVRTGEIITRTGYIQAGPETGLVNCGASPDGLIGDSGAVEAKCPLVSARHIICFSQGIPEEHWPQLEGQLLCTGRDWVDFISYDPRFIGEYEHLQVFIKRYTSKPDVRQAITSGILRLEAAVKQYIQGLPGPGDV